MRSSSSIAVTSKKEGNELAVLSRSRAGSLHIQLTDSVNSVGSHPIGSRTHCTAGVLYFPDVR